MLFITIHDFLIMFDYTLNMTHLSSSVERTVMLFHLCWILQVKSCFNETCFHSLGPSSSLVSIRETLPYWVYFNQHYIATTSVLSSTHYTMLLV